MSRFGDARWQRLAVWSGAALAWGSTVTAALLEPARLAVQESPAQVDPTNQQPALPAPPAGGLLVIRYQPDSATDQPEAVPVALAPAPQTAPEPTSSGS